MKPALLSITGKVLSVDPVQNGFSIDLLDSKNKFLKCFIHNSIMEKIHNNIKPKNNVKIKACMDRTMMGEELYSIESITFNKKKKKQ